MNYSVSDRLLGLSKIWRDVKYNFARFYEVTDDDKWDGLYREYLPAAAEENDPRRYYELLLRFINTLNDGHTYILVPDEIRPPYSVNFCTSCINGKHILTAVPKYSKKLLGAVVLAVNGISIENYLEENIYPLTWHSNITFRFFYGLLGYFIGCREQGDAVISTDKGDLTVHTDMEDPFSELCSFDTFPEHKDISDGKRLIVSEELDISVTADNIAVIGFKSCGSSVKDIIYSNAEILKSCAGYIIDVRRNQGGGDLSCLALASLFIKDPGEGGIFRQRIYSPYCQVKDNCFNRRYTVVSDDRQIIAPFFTSNKPAAVLAGGLTASAAESFLIMMKKEDCAAIIGENSAGTNGMPIIFRNSLPCGGSYAVCTMKCLTDEGYDYNNVGISPDILCVNTVDDCINGYDRIMDKGLKYIRARI